MDFKDIKEKAKNLQKKAGDKLDEAIDYSAKKLSSSSLTISTKKELEDFIEKSKTKEFIKKETWEKKYYKHKVIVLFWEEKSDFFKDSLIELPVLATKAFSQNISLKIAKSEIKGVDLKTYNIEVFPCLVVFEEQKVYKKIEDKENIKKLVKSFNLDINKQIEEL